MPALRKAIIVEGAAQVFHCVSRCVRRAYLCGVDAPSGRNHEHRRDWVRDRLRLLSGAFSVEVYAYAVMSNHLHVVLRTDPPAAAGWSPEEVVLRWRRVFPRRNADGKVIAPEGGELERLAMDGKTVAVWRRRMGSVSWLMKCLNEWIAKRANREDECTGRFWEGRFYCQRLDDASALLACMVYVDLNPVRAKLAESLDASDFTSVQDRIRAEAGRGVLAKTPKNPTAAQRRSLEDAVEEANRDAWLTPVERIRPGDMESAESPARGDGGRDTPPTGWGIEWADYLMLADETGRGLRAGKQGVIGEGVAPVLAQAALLREAWLAIIKSYGGLFSRIAGRVESLQASAKSAGQQWFWGSGRRRQAVLDELME